MLFCGSYRVSEDGKTMNLKVDVTSSSGYIRRLKMKQEEKGEYITFYSTFGINQKLGAKDEFEIALDPSCREIYFYSGNDGYHLVLQKSAENEWEQVK